MIPWKRTAAVTANRRLVYRKDMKLQNIPEFFEVELSVSIGS